MAIVPQFGQPEAGRDYADRPAAFGVAVRDGRVAVVRVAKPGHAPWIDLPGGALDAGEDAAQAVVREFGEETGLKVRAGDVYGSADQFFVNTDGKAYNNRQTLFVVEIETEAPHLKIEDDHTLEWLAPLEAIARLRHDSHAWALGAFLRRAKP
ncbi:MAG: NUDIX domain-containing protein [Phenylobacterium sp.]|uniref:NUDIX domain-containing protein n=1 Tax=Phenylobacterium sp. TaxID=1871053 RepID=UPI003919D598